MIIGIISAMEEEIQPLIDEMIIERKENKARMNFNMGKLYGHEAVLVTSGIGKVNAAVCAQILIDDFNVDKIINVGIAGGVGLEVYPGDVVIGQNLVQYDMDTSLFGDRIGQIPRLDTFDFKCDNDLVELAEKACSNFKEYKWHSGRIVTGDRFVADKNIIEWLNKEFNAMACEMEGGSIAQVCYLNNIPFVVIRSISDNAQNDAHIDYAQFKYISVGNSVIILKNMLKDM